MVTQSKTKLVAIVDDDESMRNALDGLLKAVGFPARAFASAEEFLKSGQQHQTSCLIADIRMPGISGLELQAQLNAERCRIPIIFITAHGDAKMRMQALRAGAVEFLSKPFDDEVLLESVRAALES
jgi:FixJ family two-component response regulator